MSDEAFEKLKALVDSLLAANNMGAHTNHPACIKTRAKIAKQLSALIPELEAERDELRQQLEQLRTCLEPGKASGIMAALFSEAERLGVSKPYMSRPPLDCLIKAFEQAQAKCADMLNTWDDFQTNSMDEVDWKQVEAIDKVFHQDNPGQPLLDLIANLRGPKPPEGHEICSDCGRAMVWQRTMILDNPGSWMCPNCVLDRLKAQDDRIAKLERVRNAISVARERAAGGHEVNWQPIDKALADILQLEDK